MALPSIRRAHAKVNLTLKVLGRRADGLHELESLVAPISLADEVSVSHELRDDTHAERDVFRVYGLPSSDLAARAAREYAQAHGIVGNILVGINKKIPTAAGLGGGSSDAAAVLALLEAHFGLPAPRDLPFALGCDVPFFRQSTPAWVTGAGEHVAPVELPEIALVVATPSTFLLTKDVFEKWDADHVADHVHDHDHEKDDVTLTRGQTNGNNSAPCNSREAPGDVQHFSGVTDVAAWIRRVGNDLRGVAVRLCAEIEPLEAMLAQEGALAVSMSGSGPSVFGVFASREQARQVAEAMRASGCPFAEAARTVNGPRGTFEGLGNEV